MSEERVPMKPALGLVRDRVSTLPSRKPAAPPASAAPQAKPAVSVEEVRAAERAKEEAFAKTVAEPTVTATPEQPKAKGKAKARPAKVSESTGGMKRTTLSLPQNLVDLMTERRESSPKVGQVQFILNALAQTAPRHKELVAAEHGASVGNELFPVTTAPRVNVGKLTTISFDTAEENMKVVDTLVADSGAVSRSQLVRVVLGEVLGAS
jgi:metal-responsive CopG/Arc/MetJ family transcriptional regulator